MKQKTGDGYWEKDDKQRGKRDRGIMNKDTSVVRNVWGRRRSLSDRNKPSKYQQWGQTKKGSAQHSAAQERKQVLETSNWPSITFPHMTYMHKQRLFLKKTFKWKFQGSTIRNAWWPGATVKDARASWRNCHCPKRASTVLSQKFGHFKVLQFKHSNDFKVELLNHFKGS